VPKLAGGHDVLNGAGRDLLTQLCVMSHVLPRFLAQSLVPVGLTLDPWIPLHHDWCSAPVVAGDGVYALDYRGQLYRFDSATGTRDWDFALNQLVLRSGPVVIGDHVVFGTTSGDLAALETGSGDLVWRAGTTGGQLRSIAVTPDRLVAVRGGGRAGLIAFDSDPGGALVRVPSPTVLDPSGFFVAFAIGALVFCAVTIFGGRWLIGRAGPALAGESQGSDDGQADPSEEDDGQDDEGEG